MKTETRKEERTFPALAVLGLFTGIVLEEKGFSSIHEVLDHLYPGIMTIGCAAMANIASAEILRQHPELGTLPECTQENYEDWGKQAMAAVGPTLTVVGPHDVSEDVVSKAFSDFSRDVPGQPAKARP